VRLAPAEAGENNVCVTCHHPRQHRAGCPGHLDRARGASEETGDPDDVVASR
jgi:hypothetical protein